MEVSRFLEYLDADCRRIREVVPGHLMARVPTCPDWTVADLTRHIGQVYLFRIDCIRNGGEREDAEWPPTGTGEAEPIALLDQSYAELTTELTTRDPASPGGGWYAPDPTIRFWIRRMAQETVIHRIDAELAAGLPVSPVPDDLAVDAIDELLRVFFAYCFSQWPEDFAAALKDSPGRVFLIQADATAQTRASSWRVSTSPGELTVEGGPGESTAGPAVPDVTISGAPEAVIRWIWNRETPGAPSRVRIDGDAGALPELRGCMVNATD